MALLFFCLVACSLGSACQKDTAPSGKARSKKDAQPRLQKAPRKGQPGAADPGLEAGRRVVRWLAARDFGKVRQGFDQAMRRAFPDDAALAKWWKSIVRQTGKLIKQFSAKAFKKGRYRRVIVTCVFAIAPFDVRVLFDDKGALAGLAVVPSANPDVRPQTPRPPFPYASEEVSYDNPGSRTKIAGTLTMPTGKGPHPAVLLISGSGSQDRDGTMAGHKPFLLIADHLTRRGIAVLRVDDRGVGKSTGDPAAETIELIATDVEAGLAFLGRHKSIDPKRVGLVGHSVGGLVAPLVAARSTRVAFVVSLAGPAIRGVALIPLQVGALLRAKGVPGDVIADVVAAHRKLGPLLVSGASAAKRKRALARLAEAALRGVPANAPPRVKKAFRDRVLKQVSRPWHRSFAESDPAKHLQRVRVPILIMFGEKDTVVPAKPNVEGARQALRKAGNKHARVELLPGLNHLFQKAPTGAEAEYVVLTSTFDQAALDLLTRWLVATTRPGR